MSYDFKEAIENRVSRLKEIVKWCEDNGRNSFLSEREIILLSERFLTNNPLTLSEIMSKYKDNRDLFDMTLNSLRAYLHKTMINIFIETLRINKNSLYLGLSDEEIKKYRKFGL